MCRTLSGVIVLDHLGVALPLVRTGAGTSEHSELSESSEPFLEGARAKSDAPRGATRGPSALDDGEAPGRAAAPFARAGQP